MRKFPVYPFYCSSVRAMPYFSPVLANFYSCRLVRTVSLYTLYRGSVYEEHSCHVDFHQRSVPHCINILGISHRVEITHNFL